jgi:hypothetical protein
MEEDILRLPDIQIGRSLGAKFKNHDVVGPDGIVYNFIEGTKIQNAELKNVKLRVIVR